MSNGGLIVGPIHTDLLVRGVLSGRLPSGSKVRPAEGGAWRGLDQVREVRAALDGQAGAADELSRGLKQGMQALGKALKSSEMLWETLRAACRSVGATKGALHQVFKPPQSARCAACHGELELSPGTVLAADDPAVALSFDGQAVTLAPGSCPAAVAMAGRLRGPESDLLGLGLVPIRSGTSVIGSLELARCDHPFRLSDLQRLIPLLVVSTARLEELEPEL